MNFEDLHTTLKIWQTKFNLPIDSTGSGESRIKGVRPVRSHEYLDVTPVVETIKLVDNLEHGTLDFGITLAESGTTNSIDLIEEDDTCFLGSGHLEEFSDHSGTLTNVSLDKL